MHQPLVLAFQLPRFIDSDLKGGFFPNPVFPALLPGWSSQPQGGKASCALETAVGCFGGISGQGCCPSGISDSGDILWFDVELHFWSGFCLLWLRAFLFRFCLCCFLFSYSASSFCTPVDSALLLERLIRLPSGKTVLWGAALAK